MIAMPFKFRKAAAIALAVAIVIAGGFAPRLAHAHGVLHAKTERADRGHQHGHDHQQGVGHVHCPDNPSTKDQGGDAGSACCAAACAASVFILTSQLLPDGVHRHRAATLLVEQLRSITPSALDPPPRTN
jgi:hypothetical protein